MTRELKNALPMFARSNACKKLSKFSQLSGGVITFVFWYSVSVLKDVITQDTTGSTATKEKNTNDTYFTKITK